MGPDTTPDQSTPRIQKKRRGLRFWGLVVLAVICVLSFIGKAISFVNILLYGPDVSETVTHSLGSAIEGLVLLGSAVIMGGGVIFEINYSRRDPVQHPFDAQKVKPVLNAGIVLILLIAASKRLLPFVIEANQYFTTLFEFLGGMAGLFIAWSFLTEFEDSIWRHRRKHKPKRKNRPHPLP